VKYASTKVNFKESILKQQHQSIIQIVKLLETVSTLILVFQHSGMFLQLHMLRVYVTMSEEL